MLGLLDQRPNDAGGGKFYKRNPIMPPKGFLIFIKDSWGKKKMNIWFGGFLENESCCCFIQNMPLCVTVSPHSQGAEDEGEECEEVVEKERGGGGQEEEEGEGGGLRWMRRRMRRRRKRRSEEERGVRTSCAYDPQPLLPPPGLRARGRLAAAAAAAAGPLTNEESMAN